MRNLSRLASASARAVAAAAVTVAVAALMGCSHLDPGTPDRVPGTGERALERSLEHAKAAPAEPTPPAPADALLPPLPGLGLPPDPSEPRFDVSVHDADARRFFMSLVDGTDHNMVVHPDVSGKISLQLKSVTVVEVLDVVRDVFGFEYHHTPTGFQVTAAGLRTRIFEVDYPNFRRAGQSHTRVSSGQVSEAESGGDDDSDDESSSSTGSGGVSGSIVATDSETDLWTDIATSLHLIVGGGEGRSVITNPNSGIVVVRAMPGELRDVENYLASMERSLQRQVVLEAKIIEVTLEDGFRAGINWAGLSTPGQDDSVLVGQTGGGTSLGSSGVSEISGKTGVLDPRSLVLPSSTDASAFGGVFTIAAAAKEFAAFVELLETQGDVQVLSSPRISTVNNQKAVIKVGSDEFFVTDVSTTTVTGTSTTTNPEVTLTPFFSGIALDVTPQIGRDGYITLHVHPSISEVDDQTKIVTVGSDSVSLPLALSTIRETDSIIRARSGQVVVIGGLMQDNVSDRTAGTPWITRVPLLGRLFEQQLESGTKKELVILLRAQTVEAGTWKREIEDSVDRIRDMRERRGS